MPIDQFAKEMQAAGRTGGAGAGRRSLAHDGFQQKIAGTCTMSVGKALQPLDRGSGKRSVRECGRKAIGCWRGWRKEIEPAPGRGRLRRIRPSASRAALDAIQGPRCNASVRWNRRTCACSTRCMHGAERLQGQLSFRCAAKAVRARFDYAVRRPWGGAAANREALPSRFPEALRRQERDFLSRS